MAIAPKKGLEVSPLVAHPPGASGVHLLASCLKRMLDADINTTLSKRCDLSLPQWRILAVLRDQPKPVSQKKLVVEIAFAQGQTSRALFALQTDGLIFASQSKADRRSWNYSITDLGRKQIDTILPHMEARRDAVEGVLDRDEIAQFEATVAKLLSVLIERAQS